MPDYAIVDTHVHFWDPAHLDYAWLQGDAVLGRRFDTSDYSRACADAVDVDTIVFVQADAACDQGVAEAEWTVGLAQEDPRIQAIVAFAPLEEGDSVRRELERLAAIPMVRGVRRLLQSEPDPCFCLQPGFVEGVRALADFGLSCDICIVHHQLAGVVELVRRCPEVRFILDHIGKPDIKGRLLDPWRAELRDLAQLPNVYCKLFGLVTEADHSGWTREDLEPYVGHVVECFGFGRVAFGSDWPVATLAAEYPQWVTSLEWALRGCSAGELRRVFRENGSAFYRLAGS